ncbi:lecithin--cholesterol acyltransferase [Halorhodospira abdelmalekii]|uniref:esterase/lipase family protein n=1 Tax=Halorhodospira abdelmalekii TaxID=421629 RepID=UPI001908EA92|nr:alpha/beta fold hydrolase [Halorhodospira abdelmalekii]MBK1735559.1 lecithin--cholesterol acyltransferase [Halorhodospira abdelmalekii]
MLSPRRLLALLIVVVMPLLLLAAWLSWSEHHPEQERELRVEAHERLQEWFPEQMALPDELRGFIPRSAEHPPEAPPDVIMLHGLDEPGGIWDALVDALDEAGHNGWEFRYPNDHAIDHSADLLAKHWQQLDTDQPVTLIGHSMGGLVIRDFVTRWRYPTAKEAGEERGLEARRETPIGGTPAAGERQQNDAGEDSKGALQAPIEGPEVERVILVGTPNHGSEWARLRAWLEVREWITDIRERRFSLFASLRDGTGAAKIDLRPDSQFLAELNARTWPDQIPVYIIGGVLSEPTPAMRESLAELGEQLGDQRVVEQVIEWWGETGRTLGDGVVPVDSLPLEGQPKPLLFEASHRGLLVPGPLSEEQPPAIAPILKILEGESS